jgi:hypothetical protein
MHLLRSVPNAAIMFVTFEVVSHWLEKQTLNAKALSETFSLPVLLPVSSANR